MIMNYFIKTTVCAIFILIGLTTVFSQECQKPKAGEEVLIENVEKPKSEDYKDWQKIKIQNFSFYVPKELKQKDVSCFEGGCYKYEGGDLLLGIDINPDTYYPTFERSYTT